MRKPINKLKANIGLLHDFDFIPIWDPTVGEEERITVFKLREHILSGVTTDTVTTGATYSSGIAYFDTNKQANAYSLDLTDIILSGGSSLVTGFTYDGSNNQLTIKQTNWPDLSVYLNTFSGLTLSSVTSDSDNLITFQNSTGGTTAWVQGDGDASFNDVSGSTFYGDGSNLTGISTTDNYLTDASLSGNTLILNRTSPLSAITVDLSSLNVSGGTGGSSTGTIHSVTPPDASIYSGSTWIRTTDYEVFFYDTTRIKWLSANSSGFEGARDRKNQTNVFLRTVDGSPYNNTPYIIPKSSTIVSVVGETSTSGTFKILLSTGTTLPSDIISELVISANTFGKDTVLNIDVPEDEHIYLYMSGTSINYPKAQVYYKYRG